MLRRFDMPRAVLLAILGLVVGTSAATWAAFSASTSTPANSFSAAASFITCSTLNPTWVTGVEHGVVSTSGGGLFDYVQNATADSTVRRTGSYSLRITSPSGSTGYAGKLSGGNVLVMRFAMRFASLPPGDVSSFAGTYVSAGSNLMLGYRASDQRLTLSYGGTSPAASSMTVSAGTWYVVELRAQLGSNPRTGDWRVDGVAQPSVSSAEAPTTNTIAAFGSIVGSDVFTVNLDDIVASSAASDYPMGDGRVHALRPDGIAAHDTPGNFRHEDGTQINANSWQRLRDVPMSSTADSVQQRTTGATSYLGFTFENPAHDCVRAVSGVKAYRATSGGGGVNVGRTDILDGSTARTIFGGDMSGTALQYKSSVISPAAADWTKAAVDGLITRLGYSTDVNPVPSWEALMLEYETLDP